MLFRSSKKATKKLVKAHHDTGNNSAYIKYSAHPKKDIKWAVNEEVENIEESSSLRLVKSHEGMDKNGQKKTAKVYKDYDWDEYRVRHYTDGKHHTNADYHTNDADDAHGAAKQFIKEEKWIQKAIKHPGAETRAAEKAGMSVQSYAKKHEHDPGTAGKRARLARTLAKLNKEEVEFSPEELAHIESILKGE